MGSSPVDSPNSTIEVAIMIEDELSDYDMLLLQLKIWKQKMYVRYGLPKRYKSWDNALAAEIHGPRGIFELKLSDLNIAEEWCENSPPKRYLRKA